MTNIDYSYDVFLSFAPRDGRAIAERLYADLSTAGLRVWWDSDGKIGYGLGINETIVQAIQQSKQFVLAMTPAIMRPDSNIHAETKTALDAGRRIIPLKVIDALPPAQLLVTPWIDFRTNYQAGLLTLQATLAGIDLLPLHTAGAVRDIKIEGNVSGANVLVGSTQYFSQPVFNILGLPEPNSPVPVMWRTNEPPAYTPPLHFVGRAGIIKPVIQSLGDITVTRRLRRHFIGGARGMGKTSVLRHIQSLADPNTHFILYADLSAEAAQTSGEHDPLSSAIGQLWTQLLNQCDAAQRAHRNIAHPEQPTNVLIWLSHALTLAGQEKTLLLLIDNLQLDQEQLLLKWIDISLKGLPLIVAVAYLNDGFTPQIDIPNWTIHKLEPLMAFELRQIFDPPEMDYGQRLHELSEGRPALVEVIINEWLRLDLVDDSDNGLMVGAEDDLVDVWDTLIEERIMLAAQEAGILDQYEINVLFDWLTCAAIEGATFTETGLLNASAEDVDPKASKALLDALVSDEMPMINAVPTTIALPTPSYRFSPPGLRDFILDSAEAEDVAYYAIRVFDSLEKAASPYPFAIRTHLHSVAKLALDYKLLELQEKGLSHADIEKQLQQSEALKRQSHYQGYLDREQRIFVLRVHLSIIPVEAHDQRWPVLEALGLAMRHYETDLETAEIFRQAHSEAIAAPAAGYEIAWLYYYEQGCLDNSEARKNLLNAGWQHLPPPVANLPIGSPLPERSFAFLNRSEISVCSALLIGMADILQVQGENHLAIDCYAQALSFALVVGDRRDEATTLSNLGSAWSGLGEKRKALDYYEQALPLHRVVGDRRSEAGTLSNIGGAWSDLGEKRKTLDYYEQALPLRRAVGDLSGEASTLHNIGNAWSGLGEKRKALDYYEQALPLLRAVVNRSGEASTLHNIGSIYSTLGDFDKAVEYLTQCIALEEQIESPDLEKHRSELEHLKRGDLGSPFATSSTDDALSKIMRQAHDTPATLGSGHSLDNTPKIVRQKFDNQSAQGIRRPSGDGPNPTETSGDEPP